MIYIGSDHAGFKLKEKLKVFLKNKGYEVIDVGNTTYQKLDDYPKYSTRVAERVVKHKSSFGVMIGHSGQGEAMACNKVRGARAALAYSTEIARLARSHNNANILCLGQGFTTLPMAKQITEVFLNTRFSSAKRHHRRVKQLSRIR